ncbi:hypothetical protein Tco_1409255 [Tanacetum coccineum]
MQSPSFQPPPKSSSQPEGEHIKEDKGKKALSLEEAEKESTKSGFDDETTQMSGSMCTKENREEVKAEAARREGEIRKEELIDLLGLKVVNKYYNDKLQYDKYCDKMLNRRAASRITNCDVLNKKGPITLKVYREDGTNEIIPNFKASDLHLGEWRKVMEAFVEVPSASALQVLRILGSIFTSVYAAVQKLKKDSWLELQFNLADNSKLNVNKFKGDNTPILIQPPCYSASKDKPSPPINVSFIIQLTLNGRLKKAHQQLSYLISVTKGKTLKNPYLICDICGGAYEADECDQVISREQVCLSGGEIYDDPSLLRFFQNNDVPPFGNSRRKEEGENGPDWVIRSQFEDKLANFMMEKNFDLKGLGEMLHKQRNDMHEQFYQILSTFESQTQTPNPKELAFAITT